MKFLIYYVIFVLAGAVVARYLKEGRKARPTLRQVWVKLRKDVDKFVMSAWVSRQEDRYLQIRQRFLEWLDEEPSEEDSVRKSRPHTPEWEAEQRRAHLH